ncbi:M1 family aminopeptidase [Nannocystaceae bacterium ST9]
MGKLRDSLYRWSSPALATLSVALLVCEPAHVLSAGFEGSDPSVENFAPSGTPAQYAPDSVVDLEHAAIAVVPDLVGQDVHGVVEYRVRLLDPEAREITLHGVDLILDAATIDGSPVEVRLSDEHVHLALPKAEREHGQILQVRLQWRARPRIGLYFFGPDTSDARREALVEGEGAKARERKPGKRKRLPEREHALQAWTQGEMHETRHWLPIWDYPNDRFTTSWTVAAAKGFSVIANGEAEPLAGLDALPEALRADAEQALGRDAQVWRYEQRQDHVSYLLSMIVGRFERVAVDWRGRPVEYWMPPGHASEAELVFGRTPAMLDFFSSYVGVEFPWAKYAQTPVQEFTFGGMENVSATTMTDRIVFPARLASIEDRDSLVAHELSHQWWGDLLTCREWAHAWLNEGFATYFTGLWIEHAEGDDEFALQRRSMASSYLAEAKRYHRAIVTREYRDASSMFDRHTYPKGGWVLHMLRRELGDAAFQRAIHLYAERNAFGLVETADLQRAVREASGRNLDWFFDQWVFAPGHPRLHASWAWDARDATLTITIEQLQDRPFDFQLDLAWVGGAGEARQRVHVDRRTTQIVVPAESAPRFVLIDPGLHLLAELDVDQDRQAWLAQLAEADAAIDRLRAAERLAAIGGRAVIEPLRRAVEADPQHAVRTAAAKALGRIGDAPAQQALLELWAIEQDRLAKQQSDPRVRVALLDAFADAKPAVDESEYALVERALHDDPIDHVRAAAAGALARFGEGKLQRKAIKQLHRALEQGSHHELVEEAAAKAIGKIGEAKQLDWLLELVEPERPTYLRIAAVEALLSLRGREGVLAEPQRREVANTLAAMAGDPNMRIRRAVIDDLAELELPDARERLVEIIAAELDGRVRTLAQDELRSLDHPL